MFVLPYVSFENLSAPKCHTYILSSQIEILSQKGLCYSLELSTLL